MSYIARKLCEQIVEPAVQVSTHGVYEFATPQSRTKYAPQRPGPGKPYRRYTPANRSRNKIVQKKAVPSNPPPAPPPSSNDINGPLQCNSRHEAVVAATNTRAVNTNAASPLMCDNECVTLVRSRDTRISKDCKCTCTPPKKNPISSKITQTQNYKSFSSVDKACTNHVEIVDAGTQYLDMLGERSKHHEDRSESMVDQSTMSSKSAILIKKESDKSTNLLNENYNFCKRWALAPTRVRGPDF